MNANFARKKSVFIRGFIATQMTWYNQLNFSLFLGNRYGRSKLLFNEETRQIIGCSFEVANVLGHGFHEKIYENSLVVEFSLQNIPFIQQAEFPVI